MSVDVEGLRFAGVDLSRWAPGFSSQIAGKWAEHLLAHQKGALQEDLSDGVLSTKVTLEFVAREGRSARDWYADTMTAITKTRRGTLTHPLRGSRESILADVSESMHWTDRGNVINVELTFKDAALNTLDRFSGTPAQAAQRARNQAQAAAAAARIMTAAIFAKHPPLGRAPNPFDLAIRQAAQLVETLVGDMVDQVQGYVAEAMQTIQSASQAIALGQSLRSRVEALPRQVEQIEAAIQKVGGPADTQDTITAVELSLYSAVQLDAAIQSAQPVIVTTEVAASISLYQFVQAWYGNTGRTPAELREIFRTILILNRDLLTPSLIPVGTRLRRPAT